MGLVAVVANVGAAVETDVQRGFRCRYVARRWGRVQLLRARLGLANRRAPVLSS